MEDKSLGSSLNTELCWQILRVKVRCVILNTCQLNCFTVYF